jgi:hypothetical protein
MAGLSVLASKPGLIERIFVFDEDCKPGELSETGVYKVIVFIAGCPQAILVDDIFAMSKGNKLLFSEANPSSKHVWAVILEKVWAKVNVNYERTVAGW